MARARWSSGWSRASAKAGIIGVNIGANKDSADRIADYATMTRTMAPLARYLTVNISSPNTPGLRALQDAGALAALLDAVLEARGDYRCPVFLKLAPDLEPADIDDITRIAIDKRLDALIVSNTTITRPALRSRHAGEGGRPVRRTVARSGPAAAARFSRGQRRRDPADRRRRHRQRATTPMPASAQARRWCRCIRRWCMKVRGWRRRSTGG